MVNELSGISLTVGRHLFHEFAGCNCELLALAEIGGHKCKL